MKVTRRQLKEIIQEMLYNKQPERKNSINEAIPVILGLGLAAIAPTLGWSMKTGAGEGADHVKALLDPTSLSNPAKQMKPYRQGAAEKKMYIGLKDQELTGPAGALQAAIETFDTSKGTTDEEGIKAALLNCGSQYGVAQVAVYYKETYKENLLDILAPEGDDWTDYFSVAELSKEDFINFVVSPINSLPYITITQEIKRCPNCQTENYWDAKTCINRDCGFKRIQSDAKKETITSDLSQPEFGRMISDAAKKPKRKAAQEREWEQQQKDFEAGKAPVGRPKPPGSKKEEPPEEEG